MPSRRRDAMPCFVLLAGSGSRARAKLDGSRARDVRDQRIERGLTGLPPSRGACGGRATGFPTLRRKHHGHAATTGGHSGHSSTGPQPVQVRGTGSPHASGGKPLSMRSRSWCASHTTSSPARMSSALFAGKGPSCVLSKPTKGGFVGFVSSPSGRFSFASPRRAANRSRQLMLRTIDRQSSGVPFRRCAVRSGAHIRAARPAHSPPCPDRSAPPIPCGTHRGQ